MTSIEKFQELKNNVLHDYKAYLHAIEELSFDELNDLKKRTHLLNSHKRAILSNSAYRTFINDLRPIKHRQ